MNTYFIPKQNRNTQEYFKYCSELPWVFNISNTLNIDPTREYVTLDGTITGFDQIILPIIVKPIVISKLQFLNRFTNTELAGILTEAKTNVPVEVFIKKLDAASEVDLNYPQTIEGVTTLESGGLLATGRALEILTI